MSLYTQAFKERITALQITGAPEQECQLERQRQIFSNRFVNKTVQAGCNNLVYSTTAKQ